MTAGRPAVPLHNRFVIDKARVRLIGGREQVPIKPASADMFTLSRGRASRAHKARDGSRSRGARSSIRPRSHVASLTGPLSRSAPQRRRKWVVSVTCITWASVSVFGVVASGHGGPWRSKRVPTRRNGSTAGRSPTDRERLPEYDSTAIAHDGIVAVNTASVPTASQRPPLGTGRASRSIRSPRSRGNIPAGSTWPAATQ